MIRTVILLSLALAPVALAHSREFDAFEKTIPELQSAMARGEVTSEQLVGQYLRRIAAFDHDGPAINAMIYLNPIALEEARALDRERATQGARGALHGIPVILKDNYDTHDMPTTAGSIAMTGFIPPDDAFQVRRLREAGAVFLGKANMHEFARGIETVSSLGGQTLNPYDPRRNPGGSSGGTAAAIAANYAVVGMGSDTCGSIRIPAANNNLFGLRVSQGLSSRDGIIPLSHTQDVGGPLARSVVDLAIVLDATVGFDPKDPQTAAASGLKPGTFQDFLIGDSLRGIRLGLLTDYLETAPPYGEVSGITRQAVEAMAKLGAEIVEVKVKGLGSMLAQSGVIDMEFEKDLASYLRQSNAPIQSLPALLEQGYYHAALEQRYRRSIDADKSAANYGERLAERNKLALALTEVMDANNLAALVYPTMRVKPVYIGEAQFGSLCRIAAHSGLPALTMPAGFTGDGLPVGVELLARPFQDGELIAFAYTWEQALRPRQPPPRTPSLVLDDAKVRFEPDSPDIRGKLTLERSTQTLRYRLKIRDIKVRDLLDIKIHRALPGNNGPVVLQLGGNLNGSIPIPNSLLSDLMAGRLDIVVYSRTAPLGEMRARIQPRQR